MLVNVGITHQKQQTSEKGDITQHCWPAQRNLAHVVADMVSHCISTRSLETFFFRQSDHGALWTF